MKNVGNRAGKEAVLLFTSDMYASEVPDVRRLRAFDKVAVEPGQTQKVTLSVKASDLAFVGQDGRWRLEKGDFRVACGPLSLIVRCTEDRIWEEPDIL